MPFPVPRRSWCQPDSVDPRGQQVELSLPAVDEPRADLILDTGRRWSRASPGARRREREAGSGVRAVLGLSRGCAGNGVNVKLLKMTDPPCLPESLIPRETNSVRRERSISEGC